MGSEESKAKAGSPASKEHEPSEKEKKAFEEAVKSEELSLKLPPALAALPSVPQREKPVPIRLSPPAIAMCAFNWQRPPMGKGGFSSVYEGLFYGQSAAVKVLTIRNQGEMQMFFEELRALLNPSLWHSNILPLLAYCLERPAFVFPKLKPLTKDRLPRLPESVRDAVAVSVARGLAHVHSAGFIHSDMKPDNVLCEFDGNRLLVRGVVGDMGCVRNCKEQSTPFGTILFLDPALRHGVMRYPSPAEDVYSLGLTLLSIFTNKFPENQMDIQYMFGVMEQAVRAGFPGEAFRMDMVKRLMNPNPMSRPSCADVVEQFAVFIEEMKAEAQKRAITSRALPQPLPQPLPQQFRQPLPQPPPQHASYPQQQSHHHYPQPQQPRQSLV